MCKGDYLTEDMRFQGGILNELVKKPVSLYGVIPACPESFFFSALCGTTIPGKRE
jgi:hypothetical protein